MGDEYRYPVYLECGTLSSKEERVVWRYFQNYRKSGGGECGPLTRVHGDVYEVSFKHQEDQQAVLRRKQHVLQRASKRATLVFTVRKSPEPPQALGDGTASDPPAEVTPASPCPSSGEGCELRPDGSVAGSPRAEEEDCPSPLEDDSSLQASVAGLDDEVQEDSLSLNEEGNFSLSPVETDGDAAAPHPPTSTRGGRVRVEIVEGTIESQQVHAVVSPMVGNDPLSSRVGTMLHQQVGSELLTKFKKNSGLEVELGEAVLLEDLPGLPSNAAFFLSLGRWDGDPRGTAVEVLRMAIKSVLASCDERGFPSVAFPVLGAGVALSFPNTVVAKVLLEEVLALEEHRTSSSAPLLVRVVVHPTDTESSEVFRSVQEDIYPPDQDEGSQARRILLLGKTGIGKSSLANTIFGEEVFAVDSSANSGTSKCQSETRSVDGRSVTLIDTPGFFDTSRSEEDLKREIVSCVTDCAPGPHAILILLKVDKFSKQEQDVVGGIFKYFSEDALKYAVIVFTHGNQLPDGQTVEEFVGTNPQLSDLAKRCGGRCHVFDNVYWNDAQQDDYRSNRFQRQKLLETIDRLVASEDGACYTNGTLQEVQQEIQKQEEAIRAASAQEDLPAQEVRRRARSVVSQRFLTQLAGTMTGAILGAFFGLKALARLFVPTAKTPLRAIDVVKTAPALLGAAAPVGRNVAVATGVIAGVTAATVGAVAGGVIGNEAALGAETPLEAVQMAAKSMMDKAEELKLP